MGDSEDFTQELFTIATNLYGTTADLGFVTRGAKQHADEIRALLRTECGLVQDPITGMWMRLMVGHIKMEDLKGDSNG